MKIAIDDGHGMSTPGKRTPYISSLGRQIHENEFNSGCAAFLKKAVSRCGMEYVLTTNSAVDVPLADRANKANGAAADVFISIHYNAYTSSFNNVTGIETWFYGPTVSGGDKLAKYVQDSLISDTDRKNRGTKGATNQYYVLKYTKMPAILVECGFMTNKDEALTMIDKSYQLLCAEAICKGVCKFLNVKYIGPDSGEDAAKENEQLKTKVEKLTAEIKDLKEKIENAQIALS